MLHYIKCEVLCNLPSYITDRYAGILTKEDIGQLFHKLTDSLQGNRSEAARQCGLTGKATYDWEKAAYLKLGTKRKVLEACLRTDFLNTIEYLLSRSSERTIDVLRTILLTMYAEAIETVSKEQFIHLINRFETLRIQYRGLIKDRIIDEVTDMLLMLRQKALELEVQIPKKSIDDISAKELLDLFPLISEMYLNNPQRVDYIANTLDFPLESIEMLLPTFKKLQRTGEKVTPEVETVEPTITIAGGEFFGRIYTRMGTLPHYQTRYGISRDIMKRVFEKRKVIPTFGTFSENPEDVFPSIHKRCISYSAFGGEF